MVDVVGRAIALGFTHDGLSEHAPRLRTEDLLSDELDLTPADLQSVFNDYRLRPWRIVIGKRPQAMHPFGPRLAPSVESVRRSELALLRVKRKCYAHSEVCGF